MKTWYRGDNESDPDLDRLAPQLSKLDKSNPFKVPDGYFDSLPEMIQQKINAVPDLERMNRENPFHVPEGYFDSLPAVIQQRIVDGKPAKSLSREWILNLFRPRYIAWAVVLLLLVFGIKYLTKPVILSSSGNYLSYEEAENSDFINYIEESAFIDVLDQETDESASGKEDTGIEQYLLENNIDISQLENNL